MENVEMNTDELFIVNGRHEYQSNERTMPYSVLYTLFEILRAGYLKIKPDGIIQANVRFKYGNMVFNKDEWNPLRTIERKPFRFVTSATWMAGDVAFVVEQREVTGSAADLDGSGYLKGVLKITAKAKEIGDRQPWVAHTEPVKETETAWGNLNDVADVKPISVFNRPVMWLIRVCWSVLGFLRRLIRVIGSIVQNPTSLTKLRQNLWRTADRIRMGAENLVENNSKKDKQSRIFKQASALLRQQIVVPGKTTDNSDATTSANESTGNHTEV